MAPAEIDSIVIDEDTGAMDVAVADDAWPKLLVAAARMYASPRS